MSFVKITSPEREREILEELISVRKKVRDNLLEKRAGKKVLQEDLGMFFKPVIESQKQTAEKIEKELIPIKEGIQGLPEAIPQVLPVVSIPALLGAPHLRPKDPEAFLGETAVEYLKKYADRDYNADKKTGLRGEGSVLRIGKDRVKIEGDDLIMGGERYAGTDGLWELLVSPDPDDSIYSDEDYYNYARLMLKTGALQHKYDPDIQRPRSGPGLKWRNVQSDIWENRYVFLPEKYEARTPKRGKKKKQPDPDKSFFSNGNRHPL